MFQSFANFLNPFKQHSIEKLDKNTKPGLYKLTKDNVGYKYVSCITTKNEYHKSRADILIPIGADVVKEMSYKHFDDKDIYRTNKYTIINISNPPEPGVGLVKCYSSWDPNVIYKVGQSYEINNLNKNYKDFCVPGLHFYME